MATESKGGISRLMVGEATGPARMKGCQVQVWCPAMSVEEGWMDAVIFAKTAVINSGGNCLDYRLYLVFPAEAGPRPGRLFKSKSVPGRSFGLRWQKKKKTLN